MHPLDAKSYSDLFTKDNLKHDYIQLMRIYHPDRYKGSDACKICAKINALYEEAKVHIDDDTWGDESNVIYISLKNGRKKRIKYLYQGFNETGRYYIGNTIVVFSFTKKKFFDNYLSSVKKIKYADDKIKNYFERFMPEIIDSFTSADDTYYIVVRKTADVYPLWLVMDIFKQKEHAAWLSTRLFNLSAFLSTSGIVHDGIAITTIFVSLESHGAYLLGGWQYATSEGSKMIGTNKEVYSIMSPRTKADKTANYNTDTMAIKNVIGRLLSGKDYRAKTYRDFVNIVGEVWANFLLQSDDQPIDVVHKWEDVRDKSFKEHRFVKVDIPENVYTK